VETTIGEGMFSRVRIAKVKDDVDQTPLALKILKKRDIVKMQQVDHVKSEKQILLMLSHPFIVDLLGTFQDESHLYMMMEFVNGGELHEYIQNQGGATSSEAAQFFSGELFLALAYVHSLNVAHRDLKPQNMLISSDGHLKLTDFGFAKVIKPGEKSYTLVGTPEYVAPEVITKDGHGLACDWWSYGVCLYEILAGYTPFLGEDMDSVFALILENKVDFPKSMNSKACDLIRKLLVEPEAKRLGSKAGHDSIMRDPWFRGLHWQSLNERRINPPYIPPVKGADDTSMFIRYSDRVSESLEQITPEEQEQFARFSTAQPHSLTGRCSLTKQRILPEELCQVPEQDVAFKY